MKKIIYSVALALFCAATAQAYTRQDFARQYKDTTNTVCLFPAMNANKCLRAIF